MYDDIHKSVRGSQSIYPACNQRLRDDVMPLAGGRVRIVLQRREMHFLLLRKKGRFRVLL